MYRSLAIVLSLRVSRLPLLASRYLIDLTRSNLLLGGFHPLLSCGSLVGFRRLLALVLSLPASVVLVLELRIKPKLFLFDFCLSFEP